MKTKLSLFYLNQFNVACALWDINYEKFTKEKVHRKLADIENARPEDVFNFNRIKTLQTDLQIPVENMDTAVDKLSSTDELQSNAEELPMIQESLIKRALLTNHELIDELGGLQVMLKKSKFKAPSSGSMEDKMNQSLNTLVTLTGSFKKAIIPLFNIDVSKFSTGMKQDKQTFNTSLEKYQDNCKDVIAEAGKLHEESLVDKLINVLIEFERMYVRKTTQEKTIVETIDEYLPAGEKRKKQRQMKEEFETLRTIGKEVEGLAPLPVDESKTRKPGN